MKLSPEQKKMVEDNHNLIYWYINLKGLSEDYYDLLALELCNAVMTYDPTKSTFSTFFKLKCDCAIKKEYRDTKAKKRDALFVDYEKHRYKFSSESDIIGELAMDSWVEENDTNGILKLTIQGFTQSEIAEKIGTNQSSVSRELSRLKDKLKRCMDG